MSNKSREEDVFVTILIALAIMGTCFIMFICYISINTKTVELVDLHVKVTSVTAPKHFNINMIDEQGRKVHAYSKNCTEWKNVQVGDEFVIDAVMLVRTDGVYTIDSRTSACDLARSK